MRCVSDISVLNLWWFVVLSTEIKDVLVYFMFMINPKDEEALVRVGLIIQQEELRYNG